MDGSAMTPDSPMLTPKAIRAMQALGTAGTHESKARAFLAAQDREALAGVAHRALLDLHRGAAVYVQARAVIDALLGPEA
jgi:hypothetical protein